MKIDGVSIRIGNVLEHKGKLWVAVKTQHVKPGKGGAFNQVELKCLTDGQKLNERFRSSESVERVRLEQDDYTYLYDEGEDVVFMHVTTYEQINIAKEFVGDAAAYLQDGMQVKVESHEGKPIAVELPEKVTCKIEEADPVVKGQTAASSNKPAVLENGIRIMVPPFIEAGEMVVVNTVDNSYVERAK